MKNEIILVGGARTKRTQYFLKAARELGTEAAFCPIDSLDAGALEGAVVKLDPPVYRTSLIREMPGLLENYTELLYRLGQNPSIEFLNHPGAIAFALDKRKCKELFRQHGVAATQMFAAGTAGVEQLREQMTDQRVYSVFIKPVKSSGAVGLAAYRFHPGQNIQMLYTSCRFDGTELVNTKTLRCIRDKKEIEAVLREILSLDTIVERWIPKDTCEGKVYDLRVLFQFGKIVYIVARQSEGPITNLHLNNRPLPAERLRINEKRMEEIDRLCRRAVSLIPGLRVAGIDILIEKNTKKPYIIEMNGQGDLLYQDILNENRIYKHQIQYMTQRKGARKQNGADTSIGDEGFGETVRRNKYE